MIDWLRSYVRSHQTQNRSFRRRSSQPVSWLSTENIRRHRPMADQGNTLGWPPVPMPWTRDPYIREVCGSEITWERHFMLGAYCEQVCACGMQFIVCGISGLTEASRIAPCITWLVTWHSRDNARLLPAEACRHRRWALTSHAEVCAKDKKFDLLSVVSSVNKSAVRYIHSTLKYLPPVRRCTDISGPQLVWQYKLFSRQWPK